MFGFCLYRRNLGYKQFKIKILPLGSVLKNVILKIFPKIDTKVPLEILTTLFNLVEINETNLNGVLEI